MAQDDPQNDLRIKPGGMVSSIPSHLIGLRGALPYNPSVLNNPDGFKNLVSLNGETAVPFLQRLDSVGVAGSLLLGGQTVGAGDTVDVATQSSILSQMFWANRDTSFVPTVAMFNNEGVAASTTGLNYGAYQEPFTKSGTGVTVVAGSNHFTGIGGTTWTTDQLTNAYMPAANKALNKVQPGDLIGVNNAGGTARNWFRIVAVNGDTDLTVFPTPTAGNTSIGVNRNYQIIRTGYGGYSRGIPFVDDNGGITWYYCGNSHNTQGSGQAGHGTLQAISFTTGTNNHFMGPKTVDTLGVSTGFDPLADDIAFYKGFLLYGAGKTVSWSAAGFPFGTSANPWTTTDLPARNVSAIDASSKFVTFEYLGDQLLALFEEDIWLVSATGSIPEFAFYRLPESISVEHPGAAEPCGCTQGLAYGRPSCTGRGAAFYRSNRGIEQLSGGLADEASSPISTILGPSFSEGNSGITFPAIFLSWSDDFDLLWVRQAYGTSGKNMVYNPATKDWSQIVIMPKNGNGVTAVTGGVPDSTRSSATGRVFHVGFYDTLSAAGVPGTNGGNSITVHVSPDNGGFLSTSQALTPWRWRTPIVPLGLRYPDFSFGGFLLDCVMANVTGATISWIQYGGSSPYQMTVRDSGTITPTAVAGQTPWVSSRDRLGVKTDDPFSFWEFTSSYWAQIAGLILFNANTQVVR